MERNIDDILGVYFSDNLSKDPDINGLVSAIRLRFGLEIDIPKTQNLGVDALREELFRKITSAYEEKERSAEEELMRNLERMVFLQLIDAKWKEHLEAMDYLREGIGLRAYGQRDPLVEYKREAFEMFGQMISSIEDEAVETLFKLQAAKPEKIKGVFSSVSQEFLHPEAVKFEKPEEEPTVMRDPRLGPSLKVTPPPVKSQPKVGRNDPCPCGSGKKYKKCCGK
jgi:preprotein translocase subunit SecA